ncbi:hypothetical protein IC614_02280 [Allosphingosinicella flava]|uniref:Uncharacterized protein n=1 Tax=Allosphingosinicella flava TaxID=2771430 RepID=A0A7T2GL02_9SPHN|nr:hypothetical protein [Sphingosinicella flava]QPQ55458.1 hypothetical protein IC614_02280 [Sphingosinicella flava]
MLSFWTIQRAAGTGTLSGIAALFLWPAYAAWEQVEPVFVAALALTAFCGLSMLAISIHDLATRKRGTIMRRVRAFDIVWGCLLAGPTLAVLTDFF